MLPDLGIVREDLARYVDEQLGEAAAGFWAHLRKYGGEAALPAAPSAGGPR